MDLVKMTNLRVAPVCQQGGTQTMQQAIYLTHNNPCGANQLIFQEMGLTQIRYIDLKIYLDQILSNPEVRALFEQVQIDGTEYINNPDTEPILLKYLNSLSLWAQSGYYNLPIPETKFPGYRLKFSVYDASGNAIFDSFFPSLVITYEISPGIYALEGVPLTTPNPYFQSGTTLYKLAIQRNLLAYIDIATYYPIGINTVFSDFMINQVMFPETIMATASLLIDTANARAFGIPKYGFSARSNQNWFGGIGYHCAHFIEIRTTPDENGQTTLIETLFARLSLEEDTIFLSSPSPFPTTLGVQSQFKNTLS
jgi:hypothetical protein